MSKLSSAFPDTAKVARNGHLEIGGVDCEKIAKDFGTPLYVLDEDTLTRRARSYSLTLKKEYPNSTLLYASKALAVRAVLTLLSKEGFGFDLTSSGEILTAKRARVDFAKTVLHGNNKLPHELERAVEERVGWMVVDALDELDRLHAVARAAGRRVPILLRVNPGIEAHTHSFIRTGQIDSKFGLPEADLSKFVKLLKSLPQIEFQGIHLHIGSQILDLKSFEKLVERGMEFVEYFYRSHNLSSRVLNLGGGLGVPYVTSDKTPSIEVTVKRIVKTLKAKIRGTHHKNIHLMLEPGRSVVATAGVTLYRVGVVKKIPGVRTYVSVDGGMADNPRPILYDAKYQAVLANRMNDRPKDKYTVVGRYCESGDVLLKDVSLPEPRLGDLLAVAATGAYNYSMSSNYNRVPRPAMVLVSHGKAKLIVKRETDAELVQGDL